MMAAKSSKSAKDAKNQGVQVFLRCRPMSPAEIQQKCISSVDCHGQKEVSVQDRTNSKILKTFTFDKVFGPSSSQVEVYNTVVEPLISDVLAGFNCTVFAYGQTGTGKTHTIEGHLYEDPNKLFDSDSKAGVIPRTICALFDELRILQSEYTVRISLLELYNEELYDLLSPDPVPPKLRMFDDSTKKGSVIVQGLQEVMVHTRAQVFAELRKGSAKKQVAATLINAQSSRSHTVFCVTVHMKENSMRGEELLKTGKLYLVDLAGSENIGRSGSVDKRAREAGSINQSLLTLGRVITGLVEHQPHIPYRESKLTRLLQDSLGGRTKTSFIATVSPAHINLEETLSTLEYAHRAKYITNKPEINQKVSKKVVMKEYMDVIDDLKKKLDLHRKGSGVYIADENYKEMQNEWTERNQELCEIVAEMKAVSRKMESTDETFNCLTSTLQEKHQNVEEVNDMLKKMRIRVSEAEKMLEVVKEDNKEADELVRRVAEQEEELRKRASVLLDVINQYEEDCNRIHERLDMSKSSVKSNKEVLAELHREMMEFEESVSTKFASLMSGLSLLEEVCLLCEKETSAASQEVVLFKKCILTLSMFCHNSIKQFSAILDKKNKYVNDWNKKSSSELSKSCEDSLNEIRTLDRSVSDAILKFQELLSCLPQKMASVINLCEEKRAEFENILMKESRSLCAEFEKIDAAVGKKRQDVEDTANAFMLNMQQEHNRQMDFSKSSQQSILEIKSSLLDWKSLNSQHASEALTSFEKLDQEKRLLDDIIHDYNATFEEQLEGAHLASEVSKANVNSANGSLLHDVSQKMSHIIPTLETAEQCVEGLSSLVSDVKTNQEATSRNLRTYTEESLLHRKNVLGSYTEEEAVVNEVKAALPAKTEEFISRKSNFVERIQSFIEQPCNILKSSSAQTKTLQSEINDIIHQKTNLMANEIEPRITPDHPTGHTPARAGPARSVPNEAPLPSPLVRKVKSRVQNSLEKLKNLQCVKKKSKTHRHPDDDCMASDSEVMCKRQVPISGGLAKSSSLVDLRAPSNFSLPKIPVAKKLLRSKKQRT